MGRRTFLYECHEHSHARIVDFGGWDMPLHYGSQIDEHHAVRKDAGMFDVSHMTVLDLSGSELAPFLGTLLANDVGKLTHEGKALYSCMLNDNGGVIDDLIVYRFAGDHFRMVVNAATHDKDLAWIEEQAVDYGVEVNERDDLAMIAIQGPNARQKASTLLSSSDRARSLELRPFFAEELGSWFIARTGYTGEDGWEVMVPGSEASDVWNGLQERDVHPCGLGARDTLRLEAGMNLYGADMDETTTPLESGLAWTVAWQDQAGRDRNFIGAAALRAQKQQGAERKFTGVLLEDRGVLRAHQRVVAEGCGEGEVTSGGFSPSLNRSIGLARVPADAGTELAVEIRGKMLRVRVVKPPFVRHGKTIIDL